MNFPYEHNNVDDAAAVVSKALTILWFIELKIDSNKEITVGRSKMCGGGS